MKSLQFLHCLRCVHYGVILWYKNGQVVDATGACLSHSIPDDTDAKILLKMIEENSDIISEEYRDAVSSRFKCDLRIPRLL